MTANRRARGDVELLTQQLQQRRGSVNVCTLVPPPTDGKEEAAIRDRDTRIGALQQQLASAQDAGLQYQAMVADLQQSTALCPVFEFFFLNRV